MSCSCRGNNMIQLYDICITNNPEMKPYMNQKGKQEMVGIDFVQLTV